MAAQLGSVDDIAAIHLQRCSYLREQLSRTVHTRGSSSDVAAAAALLEEAFEAGQVAAQSSPLGLCKIQRLWAAVAAVPRAVGGLGLPAKARALWDGLLKVAQPAQEQPAGPMHTVASNCRCRSTAPRASPGVCACSELSPRSAYAVSWCKPSCRRAW